MESFLALSGLGLWKEQQQIALKLHNAFPGESKYLYWALLSMIFQSPNRCGRQTAPRNPILVSIAHRCLQTLLNQNLQLKDSSSESFQKPPLEDSNKFWVVLKVLEMVGQCFPAEDHSKIVGISKLKYPESLFRTSPFAPQTETTHQIETRKGDSTVQSQISSQVASLSLKSNTRPIRSVESLCPELPEYISLAREDYFKILDSDLGQAMRKKYLHLELIWRQRAVEWANSEGLKELIDRMKELLHLGDRNWSTMTTLNQALVNLLRIEESAMNQFNLIDDLYIQLNANRKETERGYSLAQVDLRCRFRDSSSFKFKDKFNPSENLDQVVYSYFNQFGEKTCCFDDLVPYLKLLTSDEANNLSSKLKQISITSADPDSLLCESFLRRLINLQKIIRSVTSHAGDQHVIEATELLQSYFQYLPLGRDLPATTLQPADGLAILAAQALIQDWQSPDGSVANLYSATYVLETTLSKSPHQYQARSLLIRLHRLLGNHARNSLLFADYGIKHIQHDTLSHLGLDRCSIFFSHSLPAEEPEDIKRKPPTVQDLIKYPALIYEYIEADTLSWLNNCYVDEKYIQVEDLHFFYRQISSSLQRKILRMERIRLQLFGRSRSFLENPNLDESTHLRKTIPNSKHIDYPVWDTDEVEIILVEVLEDCQFTIDNRDFTVIPDSQPWSKSGTCHQTSLGPLLGHRWLWIIGTTYARIIAPHLKITDHPLLSQPDFFSECSQHEIDLHKYSKTLGSLMFSPERNLLESHAQNLVNFFERQNLEFQNLIKSPIDGQHSTHQAPPSQLLAIIHNAYEGFCLFDFAFRQNALSSSPSNIKNSTLVAKTLRSTKTKILNKLKKLDSLMQELLSVMTTDARLFEQSSDSNPTQKMICLFASSVVNQFPWRNNAMDKEFANEENWIEFLVKIHSEQRQTLEGWHSLIKLITKKYH